MKPKRMSVNGLIKQLQKISAEHGNMPVYFDTEAGQFDTHLVGIKRAEYLSKDMVGEELVYLTTDSQNILHDCQWMNDNIKLNFMIMAKMAECKSQWQLKMFNLPIPYEKAKRFPLTHASDKAFFKKYWKLDKSTYEEVMKHYFPGWLKNGNTH